MNTLFASFQPTDDILVILQSLRQAGMSWIADEIENTIRSGHPLAAGGEKSDPSEYTLTPFDSDEQLRVAIRTIQRYTIELYETWTWTEYELAGMLGNQIAHVSIAYLGNDEPVNLFNSDFVNHLTKLNGLLQQAWPFSNEPYDLDEGGH